MWVVGGFYILSQAMSAYAFFHQTGQALSADGLMQMVGLMTRAVFFYGGMLIGIGILIEMVDQIRWSGMSPEQRTATLNRRPLTWYLRRWPHDT